jgi:hypothetical protein
MLQPLVKLVIAIYDLPKMSDAEEERLGWNLTRHRDSIHKALEELRMSSDRQHSYEVVRSYFGIETPKKTLGEIGLSLEPPVSKERVSQLRNKGLRILRNSPHLNEMASRLHKANFLSRSLVSVVIAYEVFQQVEERMAAIEAVRESVTPQKHFLIDCAIGSTTADPCPTRRALVILEEHGIKEEILSLAREWIIGEATKSEWVFIPVSDLGRIPIRTANCLANEKIEYVRQLIAKTESELLRIPNFGRKSVNEIKELLAAHGLQLSTRL